MATELQQLQQKCPTFGSHPSPNVSTHFCPSWGPFYFTGSCLSSFSISSFPCLLISPSAMHSPFPISSHSTTPNLPKQCCQITQKNFRQYEDKTCEHSLLQQLHTRWLCLWNRFTKFLPLQNDGWIYPTGLCLPEENRDTERPVRIPKESNRPHWDWFWPPLGTEKYENIFLVDTLNRCNDWTVLPSRMGAD